MTYQEHAAHRQYCACCGTVLENPMYTLWNNDLDDFKYFCMGNCLVQWANETGGLMS